MDSLSVKDARQQFAKLVNSVRRGRSVVLTRRGKAVAEIAPVRSARRSRLPDLSAFRDSLGKPAKRSVATIRHLRDQERS
jgi:prevent-host-death family protein